MNRATVLWVDDEIEHLRSHVRFLEKLNYRVLIAASGEAALELLEKERVDIVLMDQMMIGMDGLETVARIRQNYHGLPVVMVTQSEEEELMDRALGGEADDYLTKPVNPSQIQLVIKRLLQTNQLRTRQAADLMESEAARLLEMRGRDMSWDSWVHFYRTWMERDVGLDGRLSAELRNLQMTRLNDLEMDFSKFIESNYRDWIAGKGTPLMPHNFLERIMAPLLQSSREVVLILIDCMRYDQWLTMTPSLESWFHNETSFMCTTLPSATPYSRNALFAGLLPRDIARFYRNDWQEEYGLPGLNRSEQTHLTDALLRLGVAGREGARFAKVANQREGEALRRNLSQLLESGFLALVVNYIDHLTHGRSELDLLRDLAPDVVAFRQLAGTWFGSSFLKDLLHTLSARGATVVVTSDHGSVLCNRTTPIRGARGMSSSVRCRFGHSLSADEKLALVVHEPASWGLPSDSPSKTYVFARSDYLLIHPSMDREEIRKFDNTFQHGGISLEELLVPCTVLTPKHY
jgi:CheY-like chemotaxis protein